MFIAGAAALAAGIVCGFIGSGGGTVLLLALLFVHKKHHGDDDEAKDIYAVNIAAVIAMSAVSAAVYAINGNLRLREGAMFILPAAAGGLCGALLLHKIKTCHLNKILAAITIYAGFKMLFQESL